MKLRIHQYRFKLDRYSQLAILGLAFMMIVAVSSKIISNSRPIYIKYQGEIFFPVLSNKIDKKLKKDYPAGISWIDLHQHHKVVFAPVPYDPGASDIDNALYQPPLNSNHIDSLPVNFQHWLGTNLKGDDVLSGIIHGSSVSLSIGFFSILIALIIGVAMGLFAGFYQNNSIQIPIVSGILFLTGIVFILFMADTIMYMVGIFSGLKNTSLLVIKVGVFMICVLLLSCILYQVGKWLQSALKIKKLIFVPVDKMISRVLEIFTAIPKLMLIVALASILDRGVINLILIIGLSSWAGIARLIRAETLKLKNQDFITSAKALGITNTRIILNHILPNITGPIMVSFVFGMSGAILIESGLSFLNIGVPESTITWGQLLSEGRHNISAWWLIVFPGLAIFSTVFCLNILGERFKKLLDPRNRSFQ